MSILCCKKCKAKCRSKRSSKHCRNRCILIPLSIGCTLLVISYILLFMQENRGVDTVVMFGAAFGVSYRSFYDFALVFTHSLLCVICLYYLWSNHEEHYHRYSHELRSTSYVVNFRKNSWQKLKSIFVNEMHLEWNEFNIAAIIFVIHQTLTFILLMENVMHMHAHESSTDQTRHPRQHIWTAFGFLVEALSIVLLSICLNAEHNPQFFMNRERLHLHGACEQDDAGSAVAAVATAVQIKRRRTVMNNPSIMFMVLVAILMEFFEFLTYPSVNNVSFTAFIQETYNCDADVHDIDCSLRAHFVVNELIFRVFVGVTLLNLIFFLLSVLFGEHPHYPSFGGAKQLIRPCWFTLFLIAEIMEIVLIQDDYAMDLMLFNLFWMCVQLGSVLLCCYHMWQHWKLAGHRNQWNRLNIATKYEGMLLLMLRTVSLAFIFLDAYEHGILDDWNVYRQLVITAAMYFQLALFMAIKKPAFYDDQVQFVLRFITYINAYNLVYSLIFETSHFLELLVVAHGDNSIDNGGDDNNTQGNVNYSFYLVSFSTSFAIAHSNLWFFSQFWEWTQARSNQSKMSDCSKVHVAVPLQPTGNSLLRHSEQYQATAPSQYDRCNLIY